MKHVTRLLTATALLAMGLISACTIDSADEFSRDVSVNFTGFYTNPNGGNIVAKNSGSSISSLDLRQSGDSLEAVDNNGRIWRGNLGEVQNGTSSFELNGNTSSGTEATFSGNISTSDGGSSTGGTSNARGTMQGTFIEPGRFSTFFATATIPGSTGGGGSALSISPQNPTVATNGTVVFTASGNNGTVTWLLSGTGTGSVSPQTGTTTTFKRTTAGSITITASDSSGGSASTTIN